MEGLASQLRYPLRALFADAAVTLHGTGAVTSGPWLNAGALCIDEPTAQSCSHQHLPSHWACSRKSLPGASVLGASCSTMHALGALALLWSNQTAACSGVCRVNMHHRCVYTQPRKIGRHLTVCDPYLCQAARRTGSCTATAARPTMTASAWSPASAATSGATPAASVRACGFGCQPPLDCLTKRRLSSAW